VRRTGRGQDIVWERAGVKFWRKNEDTMEKATNIMVLMAILAISASARQIDVATMPESPFADAIHVR